MTENTSTVLTQEVPYQWEELKTLAAKRDTEPVAPIAAPRVSSPIAAPVAVLSDSIEQPPKTPIGTENASLSTEQKEALIAAVSREVSEQLFEEIDLVVELALKKTRAHLKTDIRKAVSINVTRCVREALDKSKA